MTWSIVIKPIMAIMNRCNPTVIYVAENYKERGICYGREHADPGDLRAERPAPGCAGVPVRDSSPHGAALSPPHAGTALPLIALVHIASEPPLGGSFHISLI